MPELEIKYREVSELIPYVNNSRTHSDEQVLQIASSIKEFGFTSPVLIDGDNGIIAGHGRLMGAKKLGLDDVPCIELSHLSEAQKKAYIIADNQLALNSGWDLELLDLEIEALKELDFNIDLLGFDPEVEINEDDFAHLFEEDESDPGEEKHKIILEYSEEEYNEIIDKLKTITGTKESIFYKYLLGDSVDLQ